MMMRSIVRPLLATLLVAPIQRSLGFFGTSASVPKIPSSPKDRDNQAISAVKAAIGSPKTASFPLIECEFPPLQALNKLGDGSLRSAKEVDKANLEFCNKLVRSISPLPFAGPQTWLLMSSGATNNFLQKAKSTTAASAVHSLRDGLPPVEAGTICVLVSPSNRNDYEVAKALASKGTPVVIVNGFAKDQTSVPGKATMAYFLKPLTYNSQVAGYLLRCYPGKWTTVDATSKKVLGNFDDGDILVGNTNTPDLRESGQLVQKSVGERAIRAGARG